GADRGARSHVDGERVLRAGIEAAGREAQAGDGIAGLYAIGMRRSGWSAGQQGDDDEQKKWQPNSHARNVQRHETPKNEPFPPAVVTLLQSTSSEGKDNAGCSRQPR